MLKISGTNCLNILDLARLLPDEAKSLRWAVLNAYDGIEITFNRDVPSSERCFPEGTMDFDTAFDFWSKVRQTIWATYVAAETDALLDQFPETYVGSIQPDILSRYAFALQAIDSNFWFVHSNDEQFLHRLEDEFLLARRYVPGQ